MIDLTSIQGLAQTDQTRLCSCACPDPCEELGLPVALRLVKKLADIGSGTDLEIAFWHTHSLGLGNVKWHGAHPL